MAPPWFGEPPSLRSRRVWRFGRLPPGRRSLLRRPVLVVHRALVAPVPLLEAEPADVRVENFAGNRPRQRPLLRLAALGALALLALRALAFLALVTLRAFAALVLLDVRLRRRAPGARRSARASA
eukprot:9486061-Pyramimonas_sp.AAC.1